MTRIQTLEDVCTLIQEELRLLRADVKGGDAAVPVAAEAAAAADTSAPVAELEVKAAIAAEEVAHGSASVVGEPRRVRKGRGRKSLSGMEVLTLPI